MEPGHLALVHGGLHGVGFGPVAEDVDVFEHLLVWVVGEDGGEVEDGLLLDVSGGGNVLVEEAEVLVEWEAGSVNS